MTLDETILQKILEIQKSTKLDFVLHVDSKAFALKNVSILKTPTPVNKPTSRGGVYFSDTFSFKVKAQVDDLSLEPLLSKSMLGPNTDFQELEIITNAKINDSIKKISLYVHLTNSMQSASYIELNMNLIKINCE